MPLCQVNPSHPVNLSGRPDIATHFPEVAPLVAYIVHLFRGPPLQPLVPALPVVELKWFYDPNPVKILVKAEGTNSYNSNTAFGFWSVENKLAAPITEITFDFKASSNSQHAANGVFDVDQASMADVFWGGNSKVSGCKGTYRNKCYTACGLIYDSKNTYAGPTGGPTCDPGANCGFIATNKTSGHSYQTVKFRFKAPQFLMGKKFEFDADVDGGAGYSGTGVAGVVVTIKLLTAKVYKAELKAVAGKNLSTIEFR